jgi:hypothetical protein
LIKRKWQGSEKCCFCDQKETSQHLFIQYPLGKMVWRIVHMASGIIPPTSIKNLFHNWLVGVSKQEKAHIRVVACSLVWAIWKIRNDYNFNNAKSVSFMQVTPLATHRIRMWSCLQSTEKREDLATGCNRLEKVARDLYSQCNWHFDLHLTC